MPTRFQSPASPSPWGSRFPAISAEENLRTAWLTQIAMYVMGVVTFLSVLGVPDPDTSDHGAVLAFAGLEAVTALALWLIGPRAWAARLSPHWGTLTISAFVAFARPLGATPFFYIWPILTCAYFFERRDVIANLVLIGASLGLTMALFQPPGSRMMVWMGAILSLALLGGVIRMLTERIDRLMAQLRESSATDPLTGLMNRRAFAECFDSELERAKRSGDPLTLAVFDLDHFKSINDRFGHAAGDRALCEFAELLRSEQRHNDPIARIGGEEFAVLLVGADAEGARRFAVRVASSPGLRMDGEEVSLSVSAGIAAHGDDLSTQDQLLLAADAALYEAKSAGRRRVAVHGAGITETRNGAQAPEPAPVPRRSHTAIAR